MESLQLQKMELLPLSEFELQDLDGGAWPSLFKALPFAWVADQIVRNWDEIKQGLKEGYNAQV